MENSANLVLSKALELSAIERANVAELLLFSLDKVDPNIDSLWVKEVNSRIEAYQKGDINTVSIDEVFDKYRKI
ncbi:MAG: addiction module protein [Candidatus Thioglobus sp.]|jgi:putative addiction module component (TIGR02574 family)|nr:addiction module protein [Candidatus Thioglobus sp.]MBT3744948.1 addiction module protein [Candidatus Thioglobus sp.]